MWLNKLFNQISDFFGGTKKAGVPDNPGLIESPADYRDIPLSSIQSLDKFPEEYNTPYKIKVSDQNGHPHCVAHAGRAMKIEKERREQNYDVDFDTVWLYNECKKIDGHPELKGTYFRALFKVLQKKGAKPLNGSEDEAERYRIGGYARIQPLNFNSIKGAIYKNGVTILGFEGSNAGWSRKLKGHIRPPEGNEYTWRHATSGIAYNKSVIIAQNSWGCYSDDTEILTKNGWKLFKDLDKNEKVATLNKKTNKLEYQEIKDRQVYDYNGKLLYYKARDIDLLITPNHKLYYQPKHKNKEWLLKKAEDIKIKGFRMKKNAEWKGKEKKTKKVGDKEIPMDLWLEFLGYFISEGHTIFNEFWRKKRLRKRKYKIKEEQLRDEKNGRFITSPKKKEIEKEYITEEKPYKQFSRVVGISQKDRNEKIDNCLERLPWKFSRNGYSWTTNNKDLYEELKPLGKAPQKYIPNYVKELSSRQLRILFDALMLGDGSGESLKKWTYYTSSKRLADDFQEILLKIGLAGDISFADRRGRKASNGITRFIEYAVGIKTKELTPRKEWQPERITYKGKIYCVTVPNHIIYVRRNGKSVWSGNSDWGDNGYFYFNEDYMPFDGWVTLVDLPNNWRELIGLPNRPKFQFNQNLYFGLKGTDVVELQDALKWEGCFPTDVPSTGYFGDITLEAVKMFQRKYQIKPVLGYFGPKSRAKMNSLFKGRLS